MTDQSEIDPRDVVPDYETDMDAIGTNRTASPVDGVDHDWTEVHPNGSREILALGENA